MGDQQRWFKLWTSAISDPHIVCLPPNLRWAWAALGAYTKLHGTNGILHSPVENPALSIALGVNVQSLVDTCKLLPNVCVEEGKNHHGEFTVTWKNWVKYQVDSTQAQRQKTSRSKRRGEEKRTEENKERTYSVGSAPTARVEDNGFDALWEIAPFPKGSKSAARAVYSRLKPPATALDALRSQLAHKAACDKRNEFWPNLPDLERWLKKRRWEDELPAIESRVCAAHGIEGCPGCRNGPQTR